MEFQSIIDHPEWLLMLLAPLFIGLMAAEYFIGQKRGKLPENSAYKLPEVLCNFSLAGMHQLADLLTGLVIVKLYFWLFGWKLLDIEMNATSFIVLLVLQDFCYYWFHRASHRIRWMWAAHVAHHSSERMNFSTAFRQSLMYPIAGMWLFWAPLVIIGFEPKWVIFAVLLNLGLQFFVHTQWIRSLGKFELIFNTPSHHRVHHGRNPQYIDKNYAGVLIIWDKLFGTFEPEVETVRYGITKPIESYNPLTVTFSEWRDMFHDVQSKHMSLRQRLMILLAPPSDKPVANKTEDSKQPIEEANR
ncbi:sterol desaturase family protein [Vibrio europaeus]|uniref:Sterol desaturase n=1 Tax=Vibrio europaeus TaxID=300876 RepID=A0A178J6L0_9VIBR|nr:sterol desaturase family protein [Vibrio europaeus]MDC5705472.1 sterol desaturase family protein [Vibrio europaeus]MDC5710751.1 sterol desaturase family protein [Vibrio europaeus]MDC5715841.1 sterol desaturase family protein [Vibrio europaeus]MDC5720002.1 sterol desaturase family protein [Vibrio europaeus]MDC5724111.1 sterol desaturase family protein [Vibrio europaeus]